MKYYLAGIKGAGMSALALFLNDLGYEVIGYDDAKDHRFTEDKLVARNIKIYTEPNDAMDKNTIVVYSPALKLNVHPELIKANQMGLEIYEYQEMLGKLTKKFETICISGCHGKTTTTAMLSKVLEDTVGCSYIIGDGVGKANKESKKFVLESCEYRRHFLAYEPEYVIITNIDLDHTDYFKGIDDIINAYNEFANKASKMVIACGDDPYTHSLEVNKPIFYYGLDEDNDIRAINVEYKETGISFEVEIEGNYYGNYDLPIYGKHNLLNVLAVIATCYYERMEAKVISKVLKTYQGAKRRFSETKVGNSIIIDDYAHHPNEVKATLKAIRQKYPNKKLIAIFQPHTYSRTNEFKEDLVNAFKNVDEAYIMDIHGAREKQEDFEGITSDVIISKLDNGHHINLDEANTLAKYDDAVFAFMSPNDISKLEDDLKSLIEHK